MRLVLACAALCAASTLVACGSDGTTPASPDAGTTPRGAYPSGPYGKAEGALIGPLSFTLPDGTPRTLEDVWKDEGNRLLLLVTASGWCTSCVEEQPALERLHGEWDARGLVIIEALFETQDFAPGDAALAASWKRQYNLSFDVVADPPFVLGDYYDKALTPMNMLVDVSTMKIIRIATGWDPNATEALIRARLQ